VPRVGRDLLHPDTRLDRVHLSLRLKQVHQLRKLGVVKSGGSVRVAIDDCGGQLDMATAIDPRVQGIPSTKGTL